MAHEICWTDVDAASLSMGATRPAAAVLDEPSFRRLYERTSGGLASYLRRLSGDEALAQDVAQETYLKLLRTPVDPTDDARLRSFVYRIATNLMHDHWRRRNRDSILASWIERLAEPFKAQRLSVDLERALAQLRPRERAMLLLAYVEGFDHAEIAAILGLKEKSVRVMLFRIRAKMRTLVTEGRMATEDVA